MNAMQYGLFSALAASLMLSGCASTAVKTGVNYGDAQAVETLTADFGSSDLQQTASKMVDDLMSFPPIIELTKTRRPVLFVERIKNKTTEHIDTESLTDTIQSRLINSGKFRFADMAAAAAAAEQMNYQAQSGMVNQSTATRAGQQIGAEYMLYGNLSSIVKNADGKKDVYYKFTLKLMHLATGMVEWSSEKEIRKTAVRPTFGR